MPGFKYLIENRVSERYQLFRRSRESRAIRGFRQANQTVGKYQRADVRPSG